MERKHMETQMRRRTLRFRRGATFVAVKPIRLSASETIEVGEVVPNTIRLHFLQFLYKRVRISEQGDPWTKQAVAAWYEKLGQEPPPELVAESDGLKVFFVGSGWYSVRNAADTEVEKLRGQEALDAWKAEHTAEDHPGADTEPDGKAGTTEGDTGAEPVG